MQTKERLPEPGVIHRLFDEPARYQFKQALRLLLKWLRGLGISHDDAFADVLRFQNSVSLGFPASEIEALKAEFFPLPEEVEGLGPAPQAARPKQIAITPAFIGLLGSNGTLPFHYTERIAAKQLHAKDESSRVFLDIISNRMVGLFFEAWGKYRLEAKIDTHGVDPLRPMLTQLGGSQDEDFAQFDGGDSAISAYFSSLFRTRPTSAYAIARAIEDHFDVPIEIDQFVGCWTNLDPRARTILGRPSPALGMGATLGTRIWRRDLRMRLHIGPVGKQGLDRFLPCGKAAKDLAILLNQFDCSHFEFEVRLILKPECIKPAALTSISAKANRLGWDSFLAGDNGKDRDVRYMLRMHAPPPHIATPLRMVM
jgi:type VI secretion system protein ImpH